VATQLIAGEKRIACLSVLDSGADHCVFPLEFARQLGFNPEGTTPVMTEGVGSAGVPMYCWTITIDLGAAKVEVIAGFTEDMNGRGIGLLGQYGFFDHFKFSSIFLPGSFGLKFPIRHNQPLHNRRSIASWHS
jgi:hypothetical protein